MILHSYHEDGFEVVVHTQPEQDHVSEFFDDSCHNIKEMERKISYGVYKWFRLHVQVNVADVPLAQSHLAGCLYEQESQVLCDGVADALIQETLSQAKQTWHKMAMVCKPNGW